MSLKSVSILVLISLLLAACSATATPTLVVSQGNEIPPQTQASSPTQKTAPTQSGNPTPYPAPGSLPTQSSSSAYPAPGGSGSDSNAIKASGYEPQASDSSLKRDMVTVDMNASQLTVIATEPAEANAILVGTMPDPCHTLRVVVTPADDSNTISLEAYSLYDPTTGCVEKIETFTALIPLGSYASGQYTVTVNDSRLGQFDTVFAPQPADNKLKRGEATVDLQTSRVLMSATEANGVNADLKGYLPDPCHQLRIVMTPADSSGKINLEVYSVYPGGTACVTVIQPFDVIYPIGVFTTGHYSVYVNGELLGEFDI